MKLPQGYNVARLIAEQHIVSKKIVAYKWNTAVCAHVYLWLVGIDEDPWVAQWAAASITFDNPFMRPSNRLLMNQGDSSLGLWLE